MAARTRANVQLAALAVVLLGFWHLAVWVTSDGLGIGIEVWEIPRKAIDGTPISASAVRALLGRGQAQTLHQLVPETTWRYLQQHRMIGGDEDIHDIP